MCQLPSLAILVSAVLVLSCGQTDRQTDRITDADQRYTVGVSNYLIADADDDAVLDMSSADRESV